MTHSLYLPIHLLSGGQISVLWPHSPGASQIALLRRKIPTTNSYSGEHGGGRVWMSTLYVISHLMYHIPH